MVLSRRREYEELYCMLPRVDPTFFVDEAGWLALAPFDLDLCFWFLSLLSFCFWVSRGGLLAFAAACFAVR